MHEAEDRAQSVLVTNARVTKDGTQGTPRVKMDEETKRSPRRGWKCRRKCRRKPGKTNFQEAGKVSWYQILWGAQAEHKELVGLGHGSAHGVIRGQQDKVTPDHVTNGPGPRLDLRQFLRALKQELLAVLLGHEIKTVKHDIYIWLFI